MSVISALDEAGEAALGRLETGPHILDDAWRATAAQQLDQPLAVLPRPFGADPHPAVGQVGGLADQAQLQRPAPGPPAEPHTLHVTRDQGRQPDRGPARRILAPFGRALVLELAHAAVRRGGRWHLGQK